MYYTLRSAAGYYRGRSCASGQLEPARDCAAWRYERAVWRAWRGKRRSSTDLGPFSTSLWIGIIILRRRSSSVGQNADTPKRGGRRPSEGKTSAHAYQRRHGPACDAGRSGGCNGAVRRSRTRDLHDGHWAPARRGSHEDLREHEPTVGRRHGVGRRCGPLYEGTCLRLSAASSWPMGEGARRAWLRPARRHGFVRCTAGPPHVSAYNDEAEPRRVPTLPYTLYASTTMRGGPTRRCARPAKARSGCLPDGHWGPAPRGSHEGLREHVPAVGRRRGVDQRCGPLYEGTRPRLSTASSWPTGTGSASRVVGASSPAWFVCRTAGPPHVSAYNDEPEPRRVPTLPYTLDASTAMRGGPTRRCPGAERSGAIVHAFYIKTSTIRSPTCTRARSTT